MNAFEYKEGEVIIIQTLTFLRILTSLKIINHDRHCNRPYPRATIITDVYIITGIDLQFNNISVLPCANNYKGAKISCLIELFVLDVM